MAVWDLAVQVMDLFEKGALKDQKLNTKSLLAKPEFKQQYLAPLRAIEEAQQCAILSSVVKKEASLNDIRVLAKKVKQITLLKTVKSLFASLTNTNTWEEAQQRFPNQGTESKLQRFVEFDLKTVPKAFQSFCQQVVSSASSLASATRLTDHVFNHSLESGHKCFAAVLVSVLTELSGDLVRTACCPTIPWC